MSHCLATPVFMLTSNLGKKKNQKQDIVTQPQKPMQDPVPKVEQAGGGTLNESEEIRKQQAILVLLAMEEQ